jgi:hypothetical protein
MAIGELVLELLKGEDARCLNALSLASSGVHNASEIHMYALVGRFYCLMTHLIAHHPALFLMTTNH